MVQIRFGETTDRISLNPLNFTMSNTKDSSRVSHNAADLILSCSICQEGLSTIYAGSDTDHGLLKSDHHDDPHNDHITKFWLTECAHLTCGKHLEGGGRSSSTLQRAGQSVILTTELIGAPFHPDLRPPRAPCPLCAAEKGDQSEKSLFFIQGTSLGEYDSNIPAAYFQIPPPEFTNGSPGLEALRVGPPQYATL